jgi:hypothetical protein
MLTALAPSPHSAPDLGESPRVPRGAPHVALAWVELGPRMLLLADDHRVYLARDGRRPPADDAGASVSPARLQALLDGSIAAAFRHAREAEVPPLTAIRWAFRLAGLYHLTHSTPPLLRHAAATFEATGRGQLARWARERAHEEAGHDRLALLDLAALGHDASRAVELLRPPIAMRLSCFFEAAAHAADPIAVIGYAYAIERLALTVGRPEIEAVERVLPPGVRATRCLRVHSAIGSDDDHVRATIDTLVACTPAERRAVAVAAHQTARLCFEPVEGGHPSDEEIAARLDGSRAQLVPSSPSQPNRTTNPRTTETTP